MLNVKSLVGSGAELKSRGVMPFEPELKSRLGKGVVSVVVNLVSADSLYLLITPWRPSFSLCGTMGLPEGDVDRIDVSVKMAVGCEVVRREGFRPIWSSRGGVPTLAVRTLTTSMSNGDGDVARSEGRSFPGWSDAEARLVAVVGRVEGFGARIV